MIYGKIYLHTSRFPETGPNHIAWLKQILKQFWQKTIINAEHEQKQTQQLTEDWQETIMLNMKKTAVDRILTFYAALSPDHTQYAILTCSLFMLSCDNSHLGLCRTIPRSQQKVYSVPRTSDVQQSHLINEKRWQKTLTISHRRQCGKSQGRSLSAYRRAHTRAQALFFKKIIMCTS